MADQKKADEVGAEPASYDPRKDTGGERYEDSIDLPRNFEGKAAKVDSEEVNPEKARRDDTTVLASDQFDSEGNRVT